MRVYALLAKQPHVERPFRDNFSDRVVNSGIMAGGVNSSGLMESSETAYFT